MKTVKESINQNTNFSFDDIQNINKSSIEIKKSVIEKFKENGYDITLDSDNIKKSLSETINDHISFINSQDSVFQEMYRSYKLKDIHPEVKDLFQEYKNCSNLFNKEFKNFSENDITELITLYKNSPDYDSSLSGKELNETAYKWFNKNYKEKLDNFLISNKTKHSQTLYRGDQRYSLLDNEPIYDAENAKEMSNAVQNALKLDCVKNYKHECNINGEWKKVSLCDIESLCNREYSLGDAGRMLTALGNELREKPNVETEKAFKDLNNAIKNWVEGRSGITIKNERYMSVASVKPFAERWTSKGGETGGMLSTIEIPKNSDVISLEPIIEHDGINGWGHVFESLIARDSSMKINKMNYNFDKGILEIHSVLQ